MCFQPRRACWLRINLLLYPASFILSSCTPLCVCVSVSCHLFPGMERDVPYDLERSSDRRFLVKKPYFPQCRNRSLDYPAGTGCMYPSLFPADMCGMTSSMKCMRVEIFAQCINFSFAPHLVFKTIKSFIHIPKFSVICF